MRRKPGTDTNFRRSLPEFGCLSQGLPNGTGCLFVVSPKRLSTRDRTATRAYSAMDATICGRRLVAGHTHCALAHTARATTAGTHSDKARSDKGSSHPQVDHPAAPRAVPRRRLARRPPPHRRFPPAPARRRRARQPQNFRLDRLRRSELLRGLRLRRPARPDARPPGQARGHLQGRPLYVGYTDRLENLALTNGTVLPIGFPSSTTARQFFAKVSYLFRFEDRAAKREAKMMPGLGTEFRDDAGGKHEASAA
jgi:hypothetical protein